jgi:serine/threonine-protein kinase
MAPEIALSKKDVDARADIYAVGCVAYWLLTGSQVFDAETDVAKLLKHVREEPSPPSTRTTQSIPPRLEAVILSCLAKAPDARPQTAQALSEALWASIDERWTAKEAAEWWHHHQPRAAQPAEGATDHPAAAIATRNPASRSSAPPGTDRSRSRT